MISGIGNIPRMPSNPPETKEDKEIKKIEKSMKSLKAKLGGIKEDDNDSSSVKNDNKHTKNEKELEKVLNNEQSDDHSDENFNKVKKQDKQEVKRDLDDTNNAIKLYKSAKKTGDEKTMQKALSDARLSIKKAKDGVSDLTKAQSVKANKSSNDKDKSSSEIDMKVFSKTEKQIGQNVDEIV